VYVCVCVCVCVCVGGCVNKCGPFVFALHLYLVRQC
jgi:hypothetical protein